MPSGSGRSSRGPHSSTGRPSSRARRAQTYSGAKVGVAQHDSVDALGAELLDDRLDMAVVEQRALVIDVVDIHDVDADLAQTISRQAAILIASGALKDTAARGHKTELDLIHVHPPLITCSVNRRMFSFCSVY